MDEQKLARLIEQFSGRRVVSAARAGEIARSLGAHPADYGPMPDDKLGPGARDLAGIIDHTALKAETAPKDVEQVCQEAVQYGFAAVCINPCYVPLASNLLAGRPVAVCTVVGFPLGASQASQKAHESESAIAAGAEEIDMVLNVGMLKSGHYDYVEADIRSVVEAVGEGVVTKVILENALLTDEETVAGCLLAQNAGATFVKTSTGFSRAGANVADVALMRRLVGDEMGVKAAGGIRTLEQARALVAAGATRIGASSSVAIVAGSRDAATSSGSSDY